MTEILYSLILLYKLIIVAFAIICYIQGSEQRDNKNKAIFYTAGFLLVSTLFIF